jgi:hypothetical protein
MYVIIALSDLSCYVGSYFLSTRRESTKGRPAFNDSFVKLGEL